MKAVFYRTHGGPEVLQVGELPVPEPGDDQVLVQIAAAAVNPIDRRLRAGELQEYITRTFPVVPGWDFSGRITKVGAAVTRWKEGDEILGLAFTWSIQHGTYAEYGIVDASSIALKPKSLSFARAAALPLVNLTAWQALTEFANVQTGQKVLIQAGAGGVGSVAIPMAKHLGATVYTTASPRNAEYVGQLGADYCIDYTTVDYESFVKERESDGVDMVLEALLGEGIAEAAIRMTKFGGSVAYMNNEPPEMPDISDRHIKAEFLHHRPDGKMLSTLAGLYDSGTLPPQRIDVMRLDDAQAAHTRSESGRTQGKIVLHIQDL